MVQTKPRFATKRGIQEAVAKGQEIQVIDGNPFWIFRQTRFETRRTRPIRNGQVRLVGSNWTALLTVRNGQVIAVS